MDVRCGLRTARLAVVQGTCNVRGEATYDMTNMKISAIIIFSSSTETKTRCAFTLLHRNLNPCYMPILLTLRVTARPAACCSAARSSPPCAAAWRARWLHHLPPPRPRAPPPVNICMVMLQAAPCSIYKAMNMDDRAGGRLQTTDKKVIAREQTWSSARPQYRQSAPPAAAHAARRSPGGGCWSHTIILYSQIDNTNWLASLF